MTNVLFKFFLEKIQLTFQARVFDDLGCCEEDVEQILGILDVLPLRLLPFLFAECWVRHRWWPSFRTILELHERLDVWPEELVRQVTLPAISPVVADDAVPKRKIF